MKEPINQFTQSSLSEKIFTCAIAFGLIFCFFMLLRLVIGSISGHYENVSGTVKDKIHQQQAPGVSESWLLMVDVNGIIHKAEATMQKFYDAKIGDTVTLSIKSDGIDGGELSTTVV